MTNHLFVTHAPQEWVIPAVVVATVLVCLVVFLRTRGKADDTLLDLIPTAYTGIAVFTVLTVLVFTATSGHAPPAWISQVYEARIVTVKDAEISTHTVGGVEMEVAESKPVATMVCPISPDAAAPLDCERLDSIPVADLHYGNDLGPVSSVTEAIKKVWG